MELVSQRIAMPLTLPPSIMSTGPTSGKKDHTVRVVSSAGPEGRGKRPLEGGGK